MQREPGDGVPSSVETTAYLSYDDGHLYAVFVCKDDPAKVRANMTKREAIMGDDVVAVLLDTYNDGRRAYEFIVNPLGIQLDGVTTEGQDDDFSYDTLWQSDGKLTADGYVVLLKIPFKSLRFSSAPAQTWGVAVGRIIPRNNETSFWPYITRRIAGFGQQMATMEGLQGISPGRNLQIIPYGDFATARVLDEDGVHVTENSARAGVDGKAVIKDALTVDMTVNPDFSQIESDEPQVTVNQRFEVFFPEKRPFFIENAGYFESPQNLFFSRRIADPGVGVRLTGKARGWAFGVLGVNDEEPGREYEAGDPRSGKLAGVGVFRVQREFARQSYIGGIFTDRELGPSANRVYGADARWKFTDNWTATGQWVGSRTIDETGDSTSGTSWVAEVRREGRGFDYMGAVTSRSPDFRSELGYIRRVDMREVVQEADFAWYPENSRILQRGGGHRSRGVVGLWRTTAGLAARARFPDGVSGTDRSRRHVLGGLRALRGHRVSPRRGDGARQHRVAVVAQHEPALLPRQRDQLLPGGGARAVSGNGTERRGGVHAAALLTPAARPVLPVFGPVDQQRERTAA